MAVVGFHFVPVCPPEDEPPIASWLRDSGWPPGAGCVSAVARWLKTLDIFDARDFCGLGEIDELPGAELLAREAVSHLQSLVTVSRV